MVGVNSGRCPYKERQKRGVGGNVGAAKNVWVSGGVGGSRDLPKETTPLVGHTP